ncbi:hypothetical protein GN109_05740 [Collimonas pratensis]|uniref:hypothetical protein n=1 Tax=Collimonas pratensis TaxID=279113 RepID=UPI00143DC84D|nr:hypothetical protein [Collimonas pratensis]NKI68916.1 hypothetical protein [Collimonas pratensis]
MNKPNFHETESLMRKVFTHRSGLLALKPERLAIAEANGVIVLEFGDYMPDNGVLLADSRPKKFKGCRTESDPAATAIYVGGTFDKCKTFHHFEDFSRALKKALSIVGAETA